MSLIRTLVTNDLVYRRILRRSLERVPSDSVSTHLADCIASEWNTGFTHAQPLQVDGEPHFVALLGIVVLILLGCGLVVRNHLDREESTASEYHTHEEFLTDRERVYQLIRENGGRMKQSAIVNSVDWSKAKVSRLLAELEEEGEITKLRLGRENLVCLTGYEPAASQSTEPSHEPS